MPGGTGNNFEPLPSLFIAFQYCLSYNMAVDWAQTESLGLVLRVLDILLVLILAAAALFSIKLLLQQIRTQRKLESKTHSLAEVRDWAEVALSLILDSPALNAGERYRLQKVLVILLVSHQSIIGAASLFGEDLKALVEDASTRLAEHKLALASDRPLGNTLEPCIKSLEAILEKVSKLVANVPSH